MKVLLLPGKINALKRLQFTVHMCTSEYKKLYSFLLFYFGGFGSHGNDDIVLLSVVVVLCLEV